MSAQQHHHVSKFYLAGFTVEGIDTGRLHVTDLHSRKTWESTPEKSARERNLNRIEVEGTDPNAFEIELGRIETRAAAVIRDVVISLEPPTGEALADLIYFVAVMSEHTQPRREHWDKQEDRARRLALEVQIAHPQGFEAFKAQARARGFDVDRITQEQLLDALDGSRVRFSSTWKVQRLIEAVDSVFPLLMRRQWSLAVPSDGAGEFICSDVPAIPHDSTPMPAGIGPGLGAPEFTMPLNRGLMLMGFFELPSRRFEADALRVAILNGRTIRYAKRLYCPHEDFTWERRDGSIGNRAELLADFAENRPTDDDGKESNR